MRKDISKERAKLNYGKKTRGCFGKSSRAHFTLFGGGRYMVLITLVLILSGCLSVHKLQKPVMHYQLNPEIKPLTCSASGCYILRVAPVIVSAPYDGSRLIYSKEKHRTEPSLYYRWIASPQRMITSHLVELLSSMPLFSSVTSTSGIIIPHYILESRVYTLDCKHEPEGNFARLKAEVALFERSKIDRETFKICLRRVYELRDRVEGTANPPAAVNVVAAMNKTLGRFDKLLQKDICDYFSSKK